VNISWISAVAVSASLALAPSSAKAAWKEATLFSFNGTSGSGPEGSLIADAKGNLYGTTGQGGKNGDGTVFKLTPPTGSKTAWTHAVLYNFSGIDGKSPGGSLVLDSAGNLYGTTPEGGTSNDGTVFKLTPPGPGKSGWTESVLISFNGANGISPNGALARDAAGNLYGATIFGGAVKNCTAQPGAVGCGAIFKLSPPAKGATAWKHTLLFSFNGTNGNRPYGGLTLDAAGNLYGTISYTADDAVFELSPPKAGKLSWTETVLFAFNGTDGRIANGGLNIDKKGNLYGTTSYGGANDTGVVFKLARPISAGTLWKETVLVSFDGTHGDRPNAGLAFDAAGNVYGTTESGGGFANNFSGDVFKLAPPAAGKTAWTETVLYTFAFGGAAGFNPASGLLIGSGKSLFGTAFTGGTGHGTVFRLTP
jgi:uncharacterized repeat protein (TIGR03803 family)